MAGSIDSIGIIGLGKMGAGMAQNALPRATRSPAWTRMPLPTN